MSAPKRTAVVAVLALTVTIVAAAFAGKARVARHRMVYDALADAMQRGIHALAITAYTPEEFALLPR